MGLAQYDAVYFHNRVRADDQRVRVALRHLDRLLQGQGKNRFIRVRLGGRHLRPRGRYDLKGQAKIAQKLPPPGRGGGQYQLHSAPF